MFKDFKAKEVDLRKGRRKVDTPGHDVAYEIDLLRMLIAFVVSLSLRFEESTAEVYDQGRVQIWRGMPRFEYGMIWP